MTRKIKWVHQEDDFGCAFACLAMITGQTYEHVKHELIECYHKGITDEVIDEYLADKGYFIARRKRFVQWRGNKEGWAAPFAPVHLVAVLCSYEAETEHVVVMLKDGTVLDPTSQQPKQLSDYVRVMYVAGVVKPRGVK
jgi:hypothetical protein